MSGGKNQGQVKVVMREEYPQQRPRSNLTSHTKKAPVIVKYKEDCQPTNMAAKLLRYITFWTHLFQENPNHGKTTNHS